MSTVRQATDIRREARAPLARIPPKARSIGYVADQPDLPENQETQPPRPRRPEPGLVLARPFGIPVIISPYWFVIAGVFIFIYAQDLASTLHGSARYFVAAAFVLLLYGSVLLHELGHSLTALGYKLPVRRIVLYPLAGISEIGERQSPGKEFVVSAAGPGTSLALAGVGYCLSHFVAHGTVAGTVILELWWANLIVGLFNLLPGLPLDGGVMLRAVIWRVTGKASQSTITAAWIGRVLAVAVVVVPLVIAIERNPSAGMMSVMRLVMITVLIAAFMWAGATQSIRATRFRDRVPTVQARRLARKAISVTATTPLAEAIRRAEESQARAVVVVDHEDKPIAILNESAVMATPPQRRPWIEAGSLARTLEPSLVISADLSGMALLNAIARAPASEYLLVEPSGQVFGVLAARDIDLAFAGV
jgi:Zn-dependent protease/CBS domain-containing protein